MSKVTEINAIENEVVERDYTETELAQREIDRLSDEAKEAAQNKLAALGLTVEDLTALGL
jgi:hypothetical protein